MSKFIVELDPQFHIFHVEVEADSPAEAERLAQEQFEWDSDSKPFAMMPINVYPDEE